MKIDDILALIKEKASEILAESEYMTARDLGALTDALIKIHKKEIEDQNRLADTERETSGLAIFPSMPSRTDMDIKF